MKLLFMYFVILMATKMNHKTKHDAINKITFRIIQNDIKIVLKCLKKYDNDNLDINQYQIQECFGSILNNNVFE